MNDHDHAEEDAAARERGIEHYAERLARGEFASTLSGLAWLHDEWEWRTLTDWYPDTDPKNRQRLLACVRERDIDGAWGLMRRNALEVVEHFYDRIMREAAEHAAEELADDEDS